MSTIQNWRVELFNFIKNYGQIINNFSKVWQNKNNLIYVEMVKVLLCVYNYITKYITNKYNKTKYITTQHK
jgi:hypothetical protein